MFLITGASGNVGSAMVQCARKAHVDFIGTSFSKEISGLYKIDLTLETQVKSLFDNNEFNGVIHCSSSLNNSLKDYSSNVNQVVNICKFSKEITVINISSSGMYNLEGNQIVDENSELNIKKLYWLSKKHCEDIFLVATKPENLINLRISAPYSTTRESSSIIYTMVNSAISKKKIAYWGSGNRTQTFTNVNTLAGDVYKLIDLKIYGTFNYATSQTISMRQLAELISVNFLKFGKKIDVFAEERIDPEENFRCSIDTTKIGKHIKINNTFADDIKEIVKAKICL